MSVYSMSEALQTIHDGLKPKCGTKANGGINGRVSIDEARGEAPKGPLPMTR